MAANRHFLIVAALAIGLLPPAAKLIDDPFMITVVSRTMIFAIAAISLDLIVGYGALVSFGHAAFIGLGAYTAGILSFHLAEAGPIFDTPFLFEGSNNLFVIMLSAVLICAILAAITGAISLRTRGIHFIMITLAFAQMLFFLFISLDFYGGEDGLIMYSRNEIPGMDLDDDTHFYYLVAVVMFLAILISRRLVNSGFGRVLQGCKYNTLRMQTLGFNTFWYQLTAYVFAACLGGIAGVLLANQSEFVDPGLFHWHLSGELLVMVILGGMGSIYGAAIGAFVYLMLEQALSAYTEHWQIILGPFLILTVLFARHGLYGLIQGLYQSPKRGKKHD